jgi:hypothetical protein
MKLPKELETLTEPYYALAAPAWMQWSMMAMVLIVPPVGFIWLYSHYFSDGLEVYHYFMAVILLGVMSGAFGQNFFRKWVRFAVDHKGGYFGNAKYEFTFVPWSEVGEVSIEHLSGGRKGVLIELKVSDEVWSRIYPLHVMHGISGVKKFPIRDTGRKAEKIQDSIEQIRHIAMHDARTNLSTPGSAKSE